MEYLKRKGNSYSVVSREEAEYVIVPISEYNGLQKALRIVRDRAIQQIDKSVTDEHGYKLLRADLRGYERKGDKLWLITKSTPYSSKIKPREVQTIIEQDLRDFYNFIKLPNALHYENGKSERVSTSNIAHYYKEFFVNKQYVSGRQQYGGQNLPDLYYEFFQKVGKCITFEINKLSINHAQGVYEVSYWGTECI